MANVKINISGPLFEGATQRHVDEFLYDLRDDLGQFALKEVTRRMSVFKQPTGFYRSRTAHIRVSSTENVVTDQDTVYGPWLEWGGRGGFNGYQLWGDTRDVTERQVTRFASRRVVELVKALS